MIAWRFLSALLVLALYGLQAHALSYARDVPRQVSRVTGVQFSNNQLPDSVKSDDLIEIDLSFSESTRRIRFRLRRNSEVLAANANVQHLLSDGSVRALPGSDPAALSGLAFKGRTLFQDDRESSWTEAGWARISYQPGKGSRSLQGAFRLDGVTHHLASGTKYLKTKLASDASIAETNTESLYVWKDSDALEHRPNLFDRAPGQSTNCGTDVHNFGAADLSRRQWRQPPFNPTDVIGDTNGCPSERRVVLMGVATDCTYTSEFATIQDARDNVIDQINTASQIYEDAFNLSLVIQNLTISDASCPSTAPPSTPWNVPCTRGFDISSRLSTFSAWRGQFDDGNAIWTLMSACNTGSTVGIAWLGSVCSRGVREQVVSGQTQTVASTNVVVRTGEEWQVIAHEIGHNFGANHDCTSDSCGGRISEECCPLSQSTCNANADYLMNPITGGNIEEFSPCSIGTICTGIGMDVIDSSCFVSPGDAPDISESECGNGIVEGSEACDCGGEDGCPTDSCCDPNTCQLYGNAQCDPTNDHCCTDSCQIASSGSVCRESTGSCDPEETCDGDSAQCPEDIFEDDGDSCGDGLRCASGHCTSRDLQCITAYNETEGDVEACNLNSCQLYCSLPGQGCSRSGQVFLDGTQCGSGGQCLAGNCESPGSRGGPGGGGGGGGSSGNWLDNNRPLVIGVASGVGGLIVILIIGCMLSRFRSKRNAKRLSKQWPGSSNLVAQYVHGQRPPQWPQQDRFMYR